MNDKSSQISYYGRYQIVRELGRGAMGVVYQAHDPQIDRLIALKVLRQERVTSEGLVQRFLKEARAIGRLSHPNIVTVYDVGQDHDTIYIAMEYLEGHPLNEAVRRKGLRLEEIVDTGIQIAEALDYAHNKGIVHRDIKPTNIILAANGQVRITDFGIARIEDPAAPQQTQAGEILGTPIYMSPEQVMGRPVDGRSDLYSLGVILYELTTGKRPFSGENLGAIFTSITQDIPPEPVAIEPSIPSGLSNLIIKSIDKTPDERFQTGKAMAQTLKGSLESTRAETAPRQRTKKKSKPFGVLAASTLIAVIVVGGLAYYFLADNKPMRPAPSGPDSSAHERSTVPTTVAKPALLKVDSMPTGAQVFLDGSFKGRSPLHLELPLGKYEVRLSLPDYYEWEAQVQLRKEGNTPLFVRLVPMNERNPF